MAQKKIYLIRHGKAVMEGTDIERVLDEDGKIQAISLCKKIKEQFKDKKLKYSQVHLSEQCKQLRACLKK